LCKKSNWKKKIIIGDFPIDFDIFNEDSNYIRYKSKGKNSHKKRITIENMFHKVSIEKTNKFYQALSDLGLGRQIIGLFIKDEKQV